LKILLVCASGISTNILVKKMDEYVKEQGLDVEVIAKGLGEYEKYFERFDLILLGPQISYKREEIEERSKKPVLAILPNDYAIGNVKNIFKQINSNSLSAM
jgi:PTS system cellobiose-specific IIB component